MTELPIESRHAPAAKASLIEYLFLQATPTASPASAEGVVATLRRGIEIETLRRTRPDDAGLALNHALKELDRALARVDAEALATFQRAGLAGTPAPVDITLPPAKQARALIRTLQADDQLAGVARVAADVLAVVHVPRHLARAADLPLGGVSDVANKGNLDQLLISELANDDLTLAVRVATGEALYLRREAPARHPPVGRVILLDSGIRLWGAARLFVTSIGLALAAGADERGALSILRAGDEASPVPVDFATRAGVVDHLAVLAAAPDPLPAVRVAAARALDSAPADASTELFLVTHEQIAAAPGFTAALAALASERLTIRLATVTADGAFVLAQVNSAGKTETTRARLSLDTLTTGRGAAPADARKTRTPDRDALQLAVGLDPNLPTILRLEKFPLLLPARIDPRHAAFTPETGLVGVTHDRRLVHFVDGKHGGRQLTDRLPRGAIKAVLADAAAKRVSVVLVRAKENRALVYTHDLLTDASDLAEFETRDVLHATLHQGTILLVTRRRVVTFTPGASGPGGYDIDDHYRWHSTRYFRTSGSTAVSAATTARLIPVGPSDLAVFVFDHVDLGPVGLTHGGLHFSLGQFHAIAGIVQGDDFIRSGSHVASPDGRRVVGRDKAGDYWACLDVDGSKQRVVPNADAAHAFLVGRECAWSFAAPHQLQHKFGGLAVTNEGNLALRPKGIGGGNDFGQAKLFRLGKDGHLRLVNASRPELSTPRADQRFVPADGVPGSSIKLARAAWPNGSVAWLDARGLLHLIPADARRPQVTLTLHSDDNSPLAGWLSTGDPFGPAYFTGRPDGIGADEVFRHLQAFAAGMT